MYTRAIIILLAIFQKKQIARQAKWKEKVGELKYVNLYRNYKKVKTKVCIIMLWQNNNIYVGLTSFILKFSFNSHTFPIKCLDQK